MSPAAPLKHRIKSDGILLGSFVFSPDPAITEIYAAAGFDFVIVDLEHALNDIRSVVAHLRSAEAGGMNALVRLGGNAIADATRLLDAGAEGFVLPHLGMSSAGADEFSQAIRYPPAGRRPACTGAAAAGYGLADFARGVAAANRDVLLVGLVEDAECIDRLPRILAESGADWVMPGPSDLAASMGFPGELRHPRVAHAVDAIFAAAAAAGVQPGMTVGDAGEIAAWTAKGARFFTYSIDYKILARSLKDAATACRARFR